jgi:hypothetical protein
LCREANVVDTAVQTLGEVAAHLAWPHYQQLLGHFLKAMQRLGEANKVTNSLPTQQWALTGTLFQKKTILILFLSFLRPFPSCIWVFPPRRGGHQALSSMIIQMLFPEGPILVARRTDFSLESHPKEIIISLDHKKTTGRRMTNFCSIRDISLKRHLLSDYIVETISSSSPFFPKEQNLSFKLETSLWLNSVSETF